LFFVFFTQAISLFNKRHFKANNLFKGTVPQWEFRKYIPPSVTGYSLGPDDDKGWREEM
jgi:hypothetical protein